jgi:catechol 2,3-dioxygenase-like lactoylglutathione lyase family enzyme
MYMRRIDHLVIAVRELDEAADLYRKLGFQVGARNRHPWGTENRLIQFCSSFIELITVGADAHLIEPHQPRRFSFGAFVRDYLRQREGLAMLVLSSEDARSDAARFAHDGIGDFEPFSFSRKAKKPDGSETQVAFTLAFAADTAAPEVGFFVCQQHYPENFWSPSFQQHANSATNIFKVTLIAPKPERHQRFLTGFSGSVSRPLPDGGLRFNLDEGRIEVLSGGMRNQSNPSTMLAAFSVQVDDLDTVRELLTREGIPFRNLDQAVQVARNLLHGVELRFATEG